MTSNLVTLVRNLQQRKSRKRRGLAVVEGVRLVEEALQAGVELRGALHSPALQGTDRGSELLEHLAAHAVALKELPDRELATLADTETPQGILAVIAPPRFRLLDIEPHPRFPVLVLDGVQDPGNVGTLLRTAFALGSPGAILLTGTADVTNPKVLRGAMGATFRLPTALATEGEFAKWVSEGDVTVWGADAGGIGLERLDPPDRLAVVVGNEGAGLRPAMAALAHQKVAIRLARGAESLNVAVAAGILLYEVQRAR
jgi:TrmH family RNA methyltransferase